MSLSSNIRRVLLWSFLGAVLAGGIILALRPRPVPVDLTVAEHGLLRVVIEEEGETRVKDVYTLYAPLGGKLLRVTAEAGDRVEAEATEVARIEPTDPELLDVRTEAEQRAAVQAAEAALALALAEVDRAAADLTFARAEVERARTLITRDTISRQALDRAEHDYRVAQANLATRKAAHSVRENELARARARLLTRSEIDSRGEVCACVPVLAPVGGVVLRVLRRSEGVVQAGTPLLEIGDPARLEIAVDLLSEDAVRIAPGDDAIITGWGGPELGATVHRIEPFGRTVVSALGIEEQRVNVVLDLTGETALWQRLGHGFRVDVAIILFEGMVLKVPLGAIFRDGDGWAVFTVEDGHAALRPVTLGRRSGLEVHVLSGLSAGDRLVLYPGERVRDGVAVRER